MGRTTSAGCRLSHTQQDQSTYEGKYRFRRTASQSQYPTDSGYGEHNEAAPPVKQNAGLVWDTKRPPATGYPVPSRQNAGLVWDAPRKLSDGIPNTDSPPTTGSPDEVESPPEGDPGQDESPPEGDPDEDAPPIIQNAGLVWDAKKRCVERNQQWYQCKPCIASCTEWVQRKQPTCDKKCTPGCGCIPGWRIKDQDGPFSGTCVRPTWCEPITITKTVVRYVTKPPGPPSVPKNPCSTTECGTGYSCVAKDGLATCTVNWTSRLQHCNLGQIYLGSYPPQKYGGEEISLSPTNPPLQDAPNGCGANMVMTTCGGCENVCSVSSAKPVPKCSAPIPCKRECKCRPNFVRINNDCRPPHFCQTSYRPKLTVKTKVVEKTKPGTPKPSDPCSYVACQTGATCRVEGAKGVCISHYNSPTAADSPPEAADEEDTTDYPDDTATDEPTEDEEPEEGDSQPQSGRMLIYKHPCPFLIMISTNLHTTCNEEHKLADAPRCTAQCSYGERCAFVDDDNSCYNPPCPPVATCISSRSRRR
ncbi:hypothetical protein Q1695_003825 [Nippostrongylus brasiliensis]|nr:hypothetical protein Q1695_003825 [Nippostrongylus brasiliensis]